MEHTAEVEVKVNKVEPMAPCHTKDDVPLVVALGIMVVSTKEMLNVISSTTFKLNGVLSWCNIYLATQEMLEHITKFEALISDELDIIRNHGDESL